jgi:predicted RNA-binding Zn ribbon-like protein
VRGMTAHPVDLLVPGEPSAVRLMDTVWADRAGRHDSLSDVGDLRQFLVATVGAPAQRLRVTSGDLAAARSLRDALRRLAADVTGDDRPAAAVPVSERAAVAVVNEALSALPVPALRKGPAGWRFEPAARPSVAGVLANLAREGADLVADPTHPLRACFAPGCVLYFVRDHPRREWCSVACGNRVRAARHYARSRSAH